MIMLEEEGAEEALGSKRGAVVRICLLLAVGNRRWGAFEDNETKDPMIVRTRSMPRATELLLSYSS